MSAGLATDSADMSRVPLHTTTGTSFPDSSPHSVGANGYFGSTHSAVASDGLSSPVLKSHSSENSSSLRINLLGGSITIAELAIMSLYPIALFLGALVSAVGGAPPSYFSNKRNLINVVIVKRGWLWLTVITGYHAYLIYSRKSTRNQIALRNVVIRYTLATVWWIFFSQWFFGLPIMDKIFILTGGSCSDIGIEKNSMTTITSAQCRRIGGTWAGGYDPSGHTFLITHSSLFIWVELLPYILKHYKTRSIAPGTTGEGASTVGSDVFKSLFFKISMAFLIVYWWMLLMTGVYFHSFFEKLAGLIWGYVGVGVVFVVSNSPYLPVVHEYLSVIPV